MADLSVPFGRDAERRLPTSNERTGGFPCGPASQPLFNGMFHRLESEVGEVIRHAGLTPTDDNFTQLREAIEAIIAAATGSGDTSQYLLLSQAQARLPIFPEFLTTDGKINVSSPATGTVRIPSGIQFMHRGIFPVTTVETDFATEANKTYHIRWSIANGYEMKDLILPSYNPSSLSEKHEIFDTKYDDMLISRVITNSSNVATITNLVNKDKLFDSYHSQKTMTRTTDVNGLFVFEADINNANWSRTPKVSGAINRHGYGGLIERVPEEAGFRFSGGGLTDNSGTLTPFTDRYGVKPIAHVDTNTGNTSFAFSFTIMYLMIG